MKKILISLAAILLSLNAWAVPARPRAFNYTQPDGSVVRLERHGDEFFSWTTLAGTNQVVKLDADGFWRNSNIDPAARKKAIERRRQVNDRRVSSIRPSTHTDNIMTHGTRHIPVFLVNFQDVSFSVDNPKTRFDALLNEHGYSENGGTGSVRDYFMDNSHKQFQPVFDVYGPVTLPETMAYYGANKDGNHNIHAEEAPVHAARLLDSSVDFSQYDCDHDGFVDMLLFFFAGHNEAEGGPEDSIWPHQWTVQCSSEESIRSARFDGLRLDSYFCTSELKLAEGVNMCSIGTTCHEFGHSLGLPDFYDTDYEDNGTDHGLNSFSIMSSGCYNNNSRTPPYYNAEERICVGWMTEDDLTILPEGKSTFGSIKNDVAHITLTETEGEYFLYECRDGSGWDAPLPTGLIIYHVDKSTGRTVGGMTPFDQWNKWNTYNSINAYGDHPCFYVIPASDQANLNYNNSNKNAWFFPGSSGISDFIPIDWDGNETGTSLSGITYSNENVNLRTVYSTDRIVTGTLTDQAGIALKDVKVILSKQNQPAGLPRPTRISPRAQVFEAVTDANGAYLININAFDASKGHLTFSKEGYQVYGMDISLTKKTTVVNAKLLRNGEMEQNDICYYDPDAYKYVGGIESLGNSQMAAIRIPASELNPNGGRLLSIDFYPYYPADAYYIIMDAGKERLLTYEVPDVRDGVNDMVHIELDDVAFPGGTDLYVGYAVKNAQVDYTGCPFVIASGSNTYYSPFSMSSSEWSNTYHTELGIVFNATVALGKDPDNFAPMGIATIADTQHGIYKAGDVFQLKMDIPVDMTATSIAWRFDGLPVSDPVTLLSGRHTIQATVVWNDRSTESFELEIHVQ